VALYPQTGRWILPNHAVAYKQSDTHLTRFTTAHWWECNADSVAQRDQLHFRSGAAGLRRGTISAGLARVPESGL